jgi:lipopolysaccharide transport system permease protein
MSEQKLNEDVIRRLPPGMEKGSETLKIVLGLWKRRSLVWEMTRRELTDMHAGQAAGVVWLLAHPLLQFFVYAMLFTTVFQVRIAGKGPEDYLVYLFSGLTPWLMTQDILARSPNTIIANQSIVKKVMFPLEVLVCKTFIASLFVQSIMLICALMFIFISRGTFPLIYILLPVIFVLHLFMMWGLALLLASITPYFRDTSEIVRIFVTVIIYLLPILYLPDAAPSLVQTILSANPFSHLIWCYQDVLYFNDIEHPYSWFITTVFSLGLLISGSYIFVRLRHYFASVL